VIPIWLVVRLLRVARGR